MPLESPHNREDTMVVLLKKLLAEHPKAARARAARARHPHACLEHQAAFSMFLNPVRNNASVAHPNDELLGRQEAELVVNIGRSLLSYIDGKIGA